MQRPRGGVPRDEPQPDRHQVRPGLARGPAAAETATISSDKNLMPSMVVREQRGHLTKSQVRHQQASEQSPSDEAQSASLDEILHRTRAAAAAAAETGGRPGGGGGQLFDRDGLVLPRRVPHHHHQPGDDRQPATIRDLNRELKFNQVRGLCLLDQKSELKRAMEKIESSRRKKEVEHERLTRRTSLELRLEERAQRLARESGEGQAAAATTATESGILS